MPACMPAGVSLPPSIKLVLPFPPIHKAALRPLRQLPRLEDDGEGAAVRPTLPVSSQKLDGRLDTAAFH